MFSVDDEDGDEFGLSEQEFLQAALSIEQQASISLSSRSVSTPVDTIKPHTRFTLHRKSSEKVTPEKPHGGNKTYQSKNTISESLPNTHLTDRQNDSSKVNDLSSLKRSVPSKQFSTSTLSGDLVINGSSDNSKASRPTQDYQIDSFLSDSDLDLTLNLENISDWKPDLRCDATRTSCVLQSIVHAGHSQKTNLGNSNPYNENVSDNLKIKSNHLSVRDFPKFDTEETCSGLASAPHVEPGRKVVHSRGVTMPSLVSKVTVPDSVSVRSFQPSVTEYTSKEWNNNSQNVSSKTTGAYDSVRKTLQLKEVASGCQESVAVLRSRSLLRPVLHSGSPVPSSVQRETRGQNVQQQHSICHRSLPVKRKRKFPGPAGILPKLRQSCHEGVVEAAAPVSSPARASPAQQQDDIACSQTAVDFFHDAPWISMKTDVGPDTNAILSHNTITKIIHKASRRLLPQGKVPVIAVVVDNVKPQINDASVLFRDPSGVMQGTLHRQLLKEYPTLVQSGTVLLLRQVGVFSPSGRNHYLNVTPSNIVCIYSKDSSGESSKNSINQLEPSDLKTLLECNKVPSKQSLSCDMRPLTPKSNIEPRGHTMCTNSPLSSQNTRQGPRMSNMLLRTPQPAGLTGRTQGASPHEAPHQQAFTSRNTNPAVGAPHGHAGQRMSSPATSNQQKFPSPGSNVHKTQAFTFRKGNINPEIKQCANNKDKARTTPQLCSNRTNTKRVAGKLPQDGSIGPKQDRQNELRPSNVAATNDDLWNDENLDELLTGLDEEMLCDF